MDVRDRILVYVDQNPGVSIAQVARHITPLDPQYGTQQVKNLLRRQLLEDRAWRHGPYQLHIPQGIRIIQVNNRLGPKQLTLWE